MHQEVQPEPENGRRRQILRAEYLYRPIVNLEPGLTVDYSAWNGLIPFAFWVIDASRPRMLVELGTEAGVSYCAFCQAISYLNLPTACYAVDTWEGDQHTGAYGSEVYENLVNYHQPRYSSFSRLVKTTFDKAVEHFSNGSIDLLHIDGYHTYEAVKHDFYTWLPKLSERGLVLLHDTNVHEMDFGVWRLWEELKEQYPSFSILDSHGLGVLVVGSDLPKAIRWLTGVETTHVEEAKLIRAFFARQGVGLIASAQTELVKKSLFGQIQSLEVRVTQGGGQIAALQAQIATLQAQVGERATQIAGLQDRVQGLRSELAERERQTVELWNSNSWRMTQPLRTAKRWLAPLGTATKEILGRKSPKSVGVAVRAGSFEALSYSVDSLRVNQRRFYGFGWVFHKNQQISAVKLIVQTSLGSHVFDARYGLRRTDIEHTYPIAAARNCGFVISGLLPAEEVLEFRLQIEFQESIAQPIKIRLNPDSMDGSPSASITLMDLLGLVDDMQSGSSKMKEFLGQQPSDAVQRFLSDVKKSRESDSKFTLVIDHNLGGGANRYRDTILQDRALTNRPVLLLYFDLARLEYVLDCITAGSTLRLVLRSPRELPPLVSRIGLGEIILNNVYSFDDPLDIAVLLPELKKASGARLQLAIHDFLSICPSVHLLDENGTFCGVPERSRCEQCLPNNKGEFSFLIDHKNINSWRDTWRQCLLEATSIICFSESSAKLMQRAYPEIDRGKYLVRPHRVDYLPDAKAVIDFESVLNIGIVGSISIHKGSDVVRRLADCIRKRGLATRITVIGTLDRSPDHDFVTITGPYKPSDLVGLIEKHRVNIFLLPSIVPETFSYVTQELMALDVPLAVFNLGAPAERVANYAKGLVLEEMDAEKTLDTLIAFYTRLRKQARELRDAKDQERRASLWSVSSVPTLHAFTCAAVNYLPKVRLFCKSIKQHHPEMMVHVALADRIPGWLNLAEEPFDDIVSIESLEIPNRTGWIFWHNVVELCTAMKPFVLRYLLDLPDCDQVYYFDPDIVLFSRLDDLISTLHDANIILTPHVTHPESTIEAIRDNEICSMKHGIYNLGFIGVRNGEQGRLFAKWWSERLYYFCLDGIEQGLFTDQRWIDFAPVFFDGVRVIKSSRHNVAPWNLSTRKMEGSFQKGFRVNGEPLAFYHFTGFDSGAHRMMAMKYANGNRAVTSLIDWYEERTRSDGQNNQRWTYSTFSNEQPITKKHRWIYRLRGDLQAAFPDPFEVRSDDGSYYRWFKSQAAFEYPELLSSTPIVR
jgi:glycosyltransferase involved in cell wall biosynthesis